MKRFFWVIFPLLLSYPLSAQSEADSLIQVFEQNLMQSRQSEAEKNLFHLRRATDPMPPIDAIALFRRAKSVAEKQQNIYYIGRCNSILAGIYYSQTFYFQAIDYLIQTYQLYTDNGLGDSLGYVYIDIGNIYYAQGYNDLPENYYRKSYETFDKIHHGWGKAVALNNIALVKQRKMQWDSADYYFTMALSIRREMNIPYLIAHSYYYLGKLNRLQKKYEEAKVYLRQADSIAREALKQDIKRPLTLNQRDMLFDVADLREIFAGIHEAIGQIARDQSDLNQSLHYYFSSLSFYDQQSRYTPNVINTLGTIAEIYEQSGKPEEAERYALKALKMAEKIQRHDLQLRLLLFLANLMDKRGDLQEALNYHRRYASYKQAEENQKVSSKIADYQAIVSDYENYLRNQRTEQEIRLRDFRMRILMILLISFLITGAILFYFYRQKIRNQKILEKEIEERKAAELQARTLVTAVEQSANTIVITDVKGTIEYVNPRFTEVTGYSAAEALGQNPRILKGNPKTPVDYENLWKTILSGQVWRGMFYNRKKDGSCYWEEATITPIRNAEGNIQHFIAVKEDITLRIAAEELLKKDELRLHSALDLSQNALRLNEQEMIANAVHIVVRLTDSTLGFGYYHKDNQPGNEISYCSASPQRSDSTVSTITDFLHETGIWEECIIQNQPLIYNHFSESLKEKAFLNSFPIHNLLCVPLFENNTIRLILSVTNKPEPYDESDVHQMQSIVNDIYLMLQRKHLEMEREKIIRELQNALAKVKTLSGLLPICASCKKIRDDQGYWHQIENYISSHSEADFSHSICQDCQKKLYPELFKDDSEG